MSTRYPVNRLTMLRGVDEPEAKPVVTARVVFSTPGVTTTVTTAALTFDPDNDASEGDSDDCNEDSNAEHYDVARVAQGPTTSSSFPSEVCPAGQRFVLTMERDVDVLPVNVCHGEQAFTLTCNFVARS
jgi:hypothetical protein